MAIRMAVYLLVFGTMQVVAQWLFKWGSTADSRWLWGFWGGNLFGFSSIWLLMLMYRAMSPNVALGIGVGGAFLLSQVALMVIFKSRVMPMQWAGILAIAFGMIALAAGAKAQRETSCATAEVAGVERRYAAPVADSCRLLSEHEGKDRVCDQ